MVQFGVRIFMNILQRCHQDKVCTAEALLGLLLEAHLWAAPASTLFPVLNEGIHVVATSHFKTYSLDDEYLN